MEHYSQSAAGKLIEPLVMSMPSDLYLPCRLVLPENTYYLISLNFFRGDVNLVSSVIVAAKEDPEP